MKKRFPFVLPCLLAAFLLTACGGGDSGGGAGGSASSEEAQIERSIKETAASSDPSKCRSSATVAYLEQTTGLVGEKAIEQCEKEAPENPDAEVVVSNVDVDGAKASADVTFEGSAFDAQTVRVALAKQNGRWKADEFVQFADFDRAAVLKAIEENLEAALGSDLVSSCFLEQLEQVSDAELEKSVLSAKRGEELSIELATACSKAGT